MTRRLRPRPRASERAPHIFLEIPGRICHNNKAVYANENTLELENGVAALKGDLMFMMSDQKTTYTYDSKSQQFIPKA